MSLGLVIPGPPPRKNMKHRVFASRTKRGVVGRALTSEFKRFVQLVELAWDRKRSREHLETIDQGAWEAEVRAYWPRERHVDIDVGIGDVDAPLECVLDALQHAGVIDDDVRIVRLVATKHYDKERPRIEVLLTECSPEGQQVIPLPEEKDPYVDF